MNHPISKKVIWGFIGVCFTFFLMLSALAFPSYARHHLIGTDSDIVVKEYDTKEQIQMFGDNDAYAMGLNAEERPVFKEKWRALAQLKKDCSDGIQYIRKEHHLGGNLSIFYWDWYFSYADYSYPEAGPDLQKELEKIGNFFYIYENSFKETDD